MADNKGDALTYLILNGNNQILARSLVHPIHATKCNLQCSPPENGNYPSVAEIEGSGNGDKSLLELDLLSD